MIKVKREGEGEEKKNKKNTWDSNLLNTSNFEPFIDINI